MKEELEPQTKWEFYTFNQLAEIAEDDGIDINGFEIGRASCRERV